MFLIDFKRRMKFHRVLNIIPLFIIFFCFTTSQSFAAGSCPDDGSIPIPTTPEAGINPLPRSCEVGNLQVGQWIMDPGYINFAPLANRTYYIIGSKRYEYCIMCWYQMEGCATCVANYMEPGLPDLANPDPDDFCLNGCAYGYNYCHFYRGSWTWVCS